MTVLNSEDLYKRFVRKLEAQHSGEFAAVHIDGRVIVDKNDIEAVDRALEQFGPGNFVLVKVGSKGVGKWRRHHL